MASSKHSRKIGHSFLPFCAGIGCGILISIFLFLFFASPTLIGQILHVTTQNVEIEFVKVEKKSVENKALKEGICGEFK